MRLKTTVYLTLMISKVHQEAKRIFHTNNSGNYAHNDYEKGRKRDFSGRFLNKNYCFRLVFDRNEGMSLAFSALKMIHSSIAGPPC